MPRVDQVAESAVLSPSGSTVAVYRVSVARVPVTLSVNSLVPEPLDVNVIGVELPTRCSVTWVAGSVTVTGPV